MLKREKKCAVGLAHGYKEESCLTVVSEESLSLAIRNDPSRYILHGQKKKKNVPKLLFDCKRAPEKGAIERK